MENLPQAEDKAKKSRWIPIVIFAGFGIFVLIVSSCFGFCQ